ncbi:trypsin-like peptidase domain-containing protein [Streptomyces sp. NPDC051636]|uniref:trypsin-like peptidase domain-containing protein n=1 Tax=Streptomyces sp. NPDC051636 TaxID=3365663 RepID=UPI00379F81B3
MGRPPSEGPVPVAVRVLGDDPCADVAVLAIGYPESFENPATQKPVHTSGTVQSPNVPADPSPSLPHCPATIQHSATVNAGNSGGPLLDSDAKVVGLNTLTNPEARGQY